MGPEKLRGFSTSTTQPVVEAGAGVLVQDMGKKACEGLTGWWEEGKRQVVIRGNEKNMKRIKKWHKEREERRFPEDTEHKGK